MMMKLRKFAAGARVIAARVGCNLLVTGPFLGGLACLVYGCYLIYRPLGWLAAGALLIALAFLIDRHREAERQ